MTAAQKIFALTFQSNVPKQKVPGDLRSPKTKQITADKIICLLLQKWDVAFTSFGHYRHQLFVIDTHTVSIDGGCTFPVRYGTRAVVI